jgi:hypothetical protein
LWRWPKARARPEPPSRLKNINSRSQSNVFSSRGRFVEQRLMLSSNFMCDPIYKNERYDFGPHFVVLLKSDLGVQQTHLRPANRKVSKTNHELFGFESFSSNLEVVRFFRFKFSCYIRLSKR